MTEKKINKRLLIIIIAILCFCSYVAIITPTQLSLVFFKENTSEIAAYLPIKKGQKFAIIWTHSIHLTDVVEKYEVTEDRDVMQYEIIYEEFGIGMPSNAQEGETFVHENGKYHVKDLQNVFPSMNIRNGSTVSNHRLVWDKEKNSHRVYFNDFFDRGAWFKVKIKRLPLYKTWKEVKIHESIK